MCSSFFQPETMAVPELRKRLPGLPQGNVSIFVAARTLEAIV